jgi:hypothetical protein
MSVGVRSKKSGRPEVLWVWSFPKEQPAIWLAPFPQKIHGRGGRETAPVSGEQKYLCRYEVMAESLDEKCWGKGATG